MTSGFNLRTKKKSAGWRCHTEKSKSNIKVPHYYLPIQIFRPSTIPDWWIGFRFRNVKIHL